MLSRIDNNNLATFADVPARGPCAHAVRSSGSDRNIVQAAIFVHFCLSFIWVSPIARDDRDRRRGARFMWGYWWGNQGNTFSGVS